MSQFYKVKLDLKVHFLNHFIYQLSLMNMNIYPLALMVAFRYFTVA